jgi:hypothetical protein
VTGDAEKAILYAMPRGKTNFCASNLSVLIPRRVHRNVRAKYLAAGVGSFAAYLAWWLEKAPERLEPGHLVEVLGVEMELKCHVTR